MLLTRFVQEDELLDGVVVGDGLSFNDVVDGLVYDREGYDVPFLRFGDAGVDLELDGIEEFVYEVLEGGGFDVGHLIGLYNLDVGKEVGRFVGGVLMEAISGSLERERRT